MLINKLQCTTDRHAKQNKTPESNFSGYRFYLISSLRQELPLSMKIGPNIPVSHQSLKLKPNLIPAVQFDQQRRNAKLQAFTSRRSDFPLRRNHFIFFIVIDQFSGHCLSELRTNLVICCSANPFDLSC